ncbi:MULTISPECIES: hypothetical protein [Bacillus cereus group]|uniref:Uncharacterized protein n=1 Tax=Bacillus cereus TaxID=1396 RepID=A0A2C1LSA9_BACCE|nr:MULTISPECIES: hypothetical protein [Bacillus cereus group]MDH4422626.1 hypothetical protein [Bacillus cereus]PER24994.1 hypothetical protein CN476_13145 [Bacillus cereus]PGU01377.1 hypothetical protein COD19_13880 [Bacillus cereus]
MNGVQFVQLYVMKSAEKIDELYIRKEQGEMAMLSLTPPLANTSPIFCCKLNPTFLDNEEPFPPSVVYKRRF